MSTGDSERLAVHPLFLGLTRSAQIFGLPFVNLSVLIVAVFGAFIATGSLWVLAALVPGYAVLYGIAYRNPHFFAQLWLRFMHTPPSPYRRALWGGKSYRPSQGTVPSTVSARLAAGGPHRWEPTVERHVPYTVHVDPWTLATREDHLLQIARIPGLASETLDTDQINYRAQVWNELLRTLASPQFALYYTVVRRPVHVELPGEFQGFSAVLSDALSDQRAASGLRENVHYLTIVRREGRGAIDRAERGWRRVTGSVDRAQWRAQRERDRKALEEAVTSICTTLGPQYGAQRLQVVETPSGPRSEVLELLSEILYGEARPILLPTPWMPIHRYLAAKRLTFGHEVIEIRGPAREDVRFAALLVIRQYGAQTWPGLTDALLRVDADVRITQSFRFEDSPKALGEIGLQERRMGASEDAAQSLRAQLGEAADDLASGRVAFGHHHFVVCVSAKSTAELDAALASLQSELTPLGIVAERSDRGLLECDFFSQLPDNFAYIARPSFLSTRNFADFASLHGSPTGAERGHWGPPITCLQTTAGTPFRFHFHHKDVGHFVAIGPNGSGKTVTLNVLISEAQRLSPPPRSFFFDKDRGAQIFLEAIGGRYVQLAPHAPTRPAPLVALENSASDRAFLCTWLALLLRTDTEDLSASEREMVTSAVDQLLALSPEERSFTDLDEALAGARHPGTLRARLRPFFGTGDRAWACDSLVDGLPFGDRTLGIDLTYLLRDRLVLAPVLSYLFYRISKILTGDPTLVFIDEAAFALEHPVFQPTINDWVRTGRKKNLVLGFGTQTPQDIVSSPLKAAVIENCATQFWFPNPKADPEACRKFGLSTKEIEIVHTLPDTSRCFLLRQGASSVVARLDLSQRPELLSVLSGRAENLARMERIRARVGNDPDHWLPEFLSQEGSR